MSNNIKVNSSSILKITFDASTIKHIISKDIKYTPTMSNPQLYSSFPDILFLPYDCLI